MIAAIVLLAALPAPIPADVAAFAERHEGCVHWVGEDPSDPQRSREIQRQVEALRCDRLDRDEAELRRRYARQPAVMARLDALRQLD